jgi:Acetyltransferase (GNAT) domain
MNLRVEIVHDRIEIEHLRSDWDRLTLKNSIPMLGHDATSGFVWFESLISTFSSASSVKIVVIRSAEGIVALMPLILERDGIFFHRLSVPTVLYGGRNGFLLEYPSCDLVAAMFKGVKKAFNRWHSIHMWVVDGSDSDLLLKEVCTREGYTTIFEKPMQSPYFPLQENTKEFDMRISKGLKQRLKASPAKLCALGHLQFRDIKDEFSMDAAMDAVLAVDRESWKHETGTAITNHADQEKFYRALFKSSLNSGVLHGKILYLNQRPIAFNFGLVYCGVFSSLKHSQSTEFERFSPSHLLNAEMILYLRAMNVHIYDFMGECEPHKLQWSDATQVYTRRPIWIYRYPISGYITSLIQAVKQNFFRIKARFFKNSHLKKVV